MFFWPDELYEMHRRYVEDDHLKRLKTFEANPEALAAVTRLKGELADLFRAEGAVHFQIAKAYHYADGLKAPSIELVRAIKDIVDPDHRMNPGSLGL